jgi:hypothetical protein
MTKVNDPSLAAKHFESPPLETRMNHGFPQKLLTFSRQYGNGDYGKIAQIVVLVGFFRTRSVRWF